MPVLNKQNGLLLDTHIWIRYINGAPGVKPNGIATIETARLAGQAFVSIISIWELTSLVQKGKLQLPFAVDRWVERAFQLPGIRLLSLSPEIAIASVQLPETLNSDLADRILVASARIENLRLMSRDKNILRFAKQTSLPTEQA